MVSVLRENIFPTKCFLFYKQVSFLWNILIFFLKTNQLEPLFKEY